ncbi:hypothetical protein RJ639_032775 [Escallonia herrerae]|uniref:Protein ECERIFERUM 26-like n=1 Tax=Escallonia herrerae TaxID=1293975 RepID=A0AA89B9W6_9ASTE|nr:hypothetical protein RJ639_032775 [Escallonia herrerae]
MAQVSFICKRTVVSTKPVQPGKYSSLSVLDRVMERNHLLVVLYYRSKRGREVGGITKKLRESLSETLTSFPVATGRLLKDPKEHWMIKCNDAGVRMVEARAKGSVEEWLRNVDREQELKLVHWEEMFHKPYYWSTFYVQLTEFEEGGLAIGLSCTHLVVDPTCVTMFIKAWADTTLGGKMVSPPLFHPLPPRRPGNMTIGHKPYTPLINHYKSFIENPPPLAVALQRHSTATLTFTDQMVKSCMDMVKALTPFEALAALFWVCISNVKAKKNGSGLTNMSICSDMRKVLGLDKGFFGNCMVYNKVHMELGVQENDHQLIKAAMAIKEVVGEMDNEGIMDLIEWLEHNDNYQYSPPLMNGRDDLICINLEGVESYMAMFEDGYKPIRASYYIEPTVGEGQVIILPSPAGEGVLSRVVMVTLLEDEVVKLCKDALLMHFSPTILMGVK